MVSRAVPVREGNLSPLNWPTMSSVLVMISRDVDSTVPTSVITGLTRMVQVWATARALSAISFPAVSTCPKRVLIVVMAVVSRFGNFSPPSVATMSRVLPIISNVCWSAVDKSSKARGTWTDQSLAVS